MAFLSVRTALHQTVQPSSGPTYQPEDQVLVSREKPITNRIGDWLGPFPIDRGNYCGTMDAVAQYERKEERRIVLETNGRT